jgi:hypothetical protein
MAQFDKVVCNIEKTHFRGHRHHLGCCYELCPCFLVEPWLAQRRATRSGLLEIHYKNAYTSSPSLREYHPSEPQV